MSIDLKTCTATELSEWMLEHRFRDQGEHALVSFLLECVSALPNAQAISDEMMQQENGNEKTTEAVNADSNKDTTNDDNTNTNDLGNELIPPVQVSMTTPRVKAQLSFCESGLLFKDKKGETIVVQHAQHVVVFPVSKTSKVDRALLVFETPVAYKNKSLPQICFTWPSADPPPCNINTSSADNTNSTTTSTSEAWLQILLHSLSNHTGSTPQIARVANSTFRSYQDDRTSTTTGGLPFVQCYLGVHDGVLYPLQEGLLFCQPPRFIPRSELKSIACGRGGGGGGNSSSSRYVDVHVVLEKDDEELEFSNIHRSESDGLQKYIHNTLIPAMQRDLGDNTAMAVDGQHNGDDMLDQNDAEGARDRGKRKASVYARAINKQMTDGGDEDDDDEEEGDDDDYQSGDNDDSDDSCCDDDDEEEESVDDDEIMQDDGGDESEDDNGREEEGEAEVVIQDASSRRAKRKASSQARAAAKKRLSSAPAEDEDDDDDDEEDDDDDYQGGENNNDDDDDEGDNETESEEE